MKYSIIIPYRDRFEHLMYLLNKLKLIFNNIEHEIIISEQNDNEIFKTAILNNIGYLHSTGDILIFHQVDYVPTDNYYFKINDNSVMPVKKCVFLDNKYNNRNINDIPIGYRSFIDEVKDFYGGVLIVHRKHFEVINGYNPLYFGWGCEDIDIGKRFEYANIKIEKGNSIFNVLYHPDNCPQINDKFYDNYVRSRIILNNCEKFKHLGFTNIKYNVKLNRFKNYIIELKSNNYEIRNN